MGEEHGPILTHELKQKAASGELLPETEVRKAGTNRWVWAVQVKGLFKDKATVGKSANSQPSAANRILKKADSIHRQSSDVVVTTCDLKEPYEIIGPIYFQVSNRGIFANRLKQLREKYKNQLEGRLKNDGKRSLGSFLDVLVEPLSPGEAEFEAAFYISVFELQKIALKVGADAIVGLRQDTDLDTTGFQYFYMQSYGTAVKRNM